MKDKILQFDMGFLHELEFKFVVHDSTMQTKKHNELHQPLQLIIMLRKLTAGAIKEAERYEGIMKITSVLNQASEK